MVKIWKHFERFALYSDLKELHNLVIPEIGKFENRIISFNTEIEKTNLIIEQFDHSIAQKSNKVTLRDFQKEVEKVYSTKSDIKTFSV